MNFKYLVALLYDKYIIQEDTLMSINNPDLLYGLSIYLYNNGIISDNYCDVEKILQDLGLAINDDLVGLVDMYARLSETSDYLMVKGMVEHLMPKYPRLCLYILAKINRMFVLESKSRDAKVF